MWVTFFVDNRNDSVVLNKYQVEDEAAVELPQHITTGELLNLIMGEASVSAQALLKRDCAKVGIPLCMLNKLVLAPLERTSVLSQTSSDELPAMLRTILCQQRQISQQGLPEAFHSSGESFVGIVKMVMQRYREEKSTGRGPKGTRVIRD
ncbi:hypothetical protein HPB50_015374 [Hyalomma asiaticum]|uniref:Uncharacterized protein n=1 Tax=Hyalomma asiaticum TaxID=266040 RepID=A0ACB7S9I0_HYAAI|nr:hypothetical protein HPB50_015374 [Hyalomma asiaticum]